jgi:hypothetical protein
MFRISLVPLYLNAPHDTCRSNGMAKPLQTLKMHIGFWRPIILQVRFFYFKELIANVFPAYYLPTSSISLPLITTKKSTFCEWKGWATYYTIKSPSTGEDVNDRIWSYENPTPRYKDIKSYVSFYAGPWQCYVDGEEVKPQPGDFYGGWTTSELEGTIKGEASTRWL